jgi:hypothetical protein
MGRTNARHRFISQHIATRGLGVKHTVAFANASAAWGTATPVAKARAKRTAAFCRLHAKASKLLRLEASKHEKDDVPTLWAIGRGSQFPLHPSDFEELQRQTGCITKLSREWSQRAGRKELQ